MTGLNAFIYLQTFIKIFPANQSYAEVHHLILIAISLYLLIVGPKSYSKKYNKIAC